MRSSLLRIFIAIGWLIFFSASVSAQNGFSTGLNGTVINLSCNQNCATNVFRIPHLKTTDDYQVISVPYAPFPYVTAVPPLSVPGCTDQDDKFFDTTFLPFNFCFYGAIYSKLVVSTNGLVTFDSTNALQGSNWALYTGNQLPFTGTGSVGTGPCPIPVGALYPRASIMGAYYDLYIDAVTFPSRKMQVDVYGSAPNRQFVISYFEIPVYFCQSVAASHQIVLYEGSALIDVYIANKPFCTFNGGLAILGIQNWNRDQAVTAPGKNCTQWSEQNTGYRFVPSGATSRFVKCELLTLGGTFLALGDTVTTTAGLLDVTFPNSLCPTATPTGYIIKTTYSACDAANQIINLDTITVNKTTSLNATSTVTLTSCGVIGTGTATITVPAGTGTAPYTFVLNPGAVTFTGSSPHQFTGLNAGPYSILVTDASGGCSSTVLDTINSMGTLSVTYNVTNTSCVGASNGSITVNPPNGTPPITYSINGGAFGANNVFSNLAPATYFISTHDNAGCVNDLAPVTVISGNSITMTTAVTPTSCPGASNGTITITSATGTPPYQYSINGGAYQASNVFTNLPAGTQFISLVDAAGCTITFVPVTIIAGPATVTGTATSINTSCAGANNGSITVTPTSGVGPYQYSLNGGPFQPGNTFTGLASGNYTIIIQEAGTCTSAPIAATITSGAGITATLTPAATSCTGVNNGSVLVTPTSGTGPYTFVLNGTTTQTGATNTTFTGLSTGNHTITITDAIGCITTAPLTVNITAGPGFTATYTSTNSSCTGVSNGSITVTPGTGGTGPYTFVLGTTTQTGAVNTTFNNLAAGTHSIVVTDANGCQFTLNNATVTAGAGFIATYTATNSSCSVATNGSITVTPGAGGTGPYTFDLGTTTQTGAVNTTFNNLAAGTHTIVVTDANGCQYTLNNAAVNAGTGFTATFTATNSSCSGATNGSITVTPGAGGTGPYTFVLNGTTTQTSATSTTFNNITSGTHTVLITDANGCQFTLNNAIVAASGGFTATYTSTNSSCPGATNGSITVTLGAGGTGPYSFVLGTTTQNGATNTTFNNLASGNHSIMIRDVNGCQFTLNATVTANTGFTATYTSTNSSCTGAANGSITVTPGTGSTGPYIFVLGTTTQNGVTNTTFNNLTSGNHSVQITDANGCQSTLNATVNASAGFTATYTSTNTSCAGTANGSITVTPGTGGTAPYTFVLGTTTQTGATNTIFTNLAAGGHSVLITDANGCQFTLNATVTSSAGFTATYTSTNTSCAGAANGSITVTPGTGGTAPYTFVLGTTTQTGATNTIFTNLAAGGHSVLITDANGCQFTLNNANVTAGAALTASVTPIATACPGVSNGSIIVTPGNGNGPYTFVLNGTVTQTAATTTTFTGIAAGSHTIVVTDVNGCNSTLPPVNVVSGTGVTANVTPTGTSCTGAVNGSIAITPNNGTGPYTFVLNGTTTQTGAASTTFNTLAAGNSYSIVVTDAIGCTGTFSNIVVSQGSVLLANAVSLPTTCNGASNGQITITPTNGAGPFTFVLNGTVTQTGAANTTFTGLAAASYSIVVTDGAGCVSSPVSATVNAGPPITVSLAKTDATCFASSTGTITASPSANATAPIMYSLDNTTWQASQNFTSLPAGLYTVYIRDNTGCPNSAQITIGQPAQLSATTSVQNVLCNGQNNGVISVSVTGGTPAYSYSLNNITYQSGNSFTVATGMYTVYIQDGNNCALPPITNVNVTQPATLTATAVPGNATCDGGNDGTITITSVGGTLPYQYSLNGAAFQGSNILNVAPGTYSSVTVKDANGCSFLVPATITVGLTNNLTLTPAPDPATICEGNTIQLQLTTNATQFNWSPAATLSNSTIKNPVAKPANTTLYSVIATLGRCSLTDDVLISVNSAPIPDAGPPGDICYGQTYQLQPVGDPSFTYTWTPTSFLSSATSFKPVSNPDKTIIYSLSVKDGNGCTSLVPDQVLVKVTPPIKITTFPRDTVVFAGAQIPLLATSLGTSYSWSPASGLDNPNIANPIATASVIDGTVVTYKVTTTTSAGCQGDAFVTIRVYKGPDLYVPTAFSPNGDNKNDEFMAFPVGIKKLNYFYVFNRWGQMLFSTTIPNRGWDGRFGGVEQPSGVYVWIAEGETMDNKVITKKGTVTLIR